MTEICIYICIFGVRGTVNSDSVSAMIEVFELKSADSSIEVFSEVIISLLSKR